MKTHPSFCLSSYYCAFVLLFSLVLSSSVFAQTDETIFREFRFDFSTPGARANAMGRAFVGLADEATAAYNNPAGLSVLKRPEISMEYRLSQNKFEGLRSNGIFDIEPDLGEVNQVDLDRLGFASYAFSTKIFNFSLFFVNNLDYKRDAVEDSLQFFNTDEGYGGFLLNRSEVRKIQLNTYGLTVAHDFGRLDLGVAIAVSSLGMDFEYQTSFDSFDLGISDLVKSQADDTSHKLAYVLGLMYQVHPKIKLGLSYKLQPKFVYTEHINNLMYPPFEFPDPERNPVPIRFKIPDSIQAGLAITPNDFWTVLFDIDWVRYNQLLGENMTILSTIITPSVQRQGPGFFSFDPADFEINDQPDLHLGAEYLIPLKKNILGLRFGCFLEPDHKTRFLGNPDPGEDQELYDIQRFIYNTNLKGDSVGYTLGVGFVLADKLQWDIALVQTDRFKRFMTTVLYRF